MITNKEDFTKKRKTRLELLEDRIIQAENVIEELNKDLKEEGVNEIAKFEKVLEELREMQREIKEKEMNDNPNINEKIEKLQFESLLFINNDKVRIISQNKKLQKEMNAQKEELKKMQEDLMRKQLELEQERKKNNELLEANAVQDDKIKVLKSKAYGFDIAKKFEIHQNKINNDNKHNKIDPNRGKYIEDKNLAYNFWERENIAEMRNPSKLDELSKQKQLWIGNPIGTIEKLMNDIESKNRKNEHTSNNPYGNNRTNNNNSLNSNMRKYSPLILTNK